MPKSQEAYEILHKAVSEFVREGIPRTKRTEGKVWRSDGTQSKYDYCSHNVFMNEDCPSCTNDYLGEALEKAESIMEVK